jgi:hypothetical protein
MMFVGKSTQTRSISDWHNQCRSNQTLIITSTTSSSRSPLRRSNRRSKKSPRLSCTTLTIKRTAAHEVARSVPVPGSVPPPILPKPRSTFPSTFRCWLESSFVGTKPLESPQTPALENSFVHSQKINIGPMSVAATNYGGGESSVI